MTPRPKYPKPDANQAQIITELGQLGAWIINTSTIGGVTLDLVVCWRGLCIPVEIKVPGCELDLTDGEKMAIEQLHQRGIPAFVATCTEDVVALWPRAKGDEKRNDLHTTEVGECDS